MGTSSPSQLFEPSPGAWGPLAKTWGSGTSWGRGGRGVESAGLRVLDPPPPQKTRGRNFRHATLEKWSKKKSRKWHRDPSIEFRVASAIPGTCSRAREAGWRPDSGRICGSRVPAAFRGRPARIFWLDTGAGVRGRLVVGGRFRESLQGLPPHTHTHTTSLSCAAGGPGRKLPRPFGKHQKRLKGLTGLLW